MNLLISFIFLVSSVKIFADQTVQIIPNHFLPLKFLNSTKYHPKFPTVLPNCTVDSIKSGQWITDVSNCGIRAIYDHPLTEPAVTVADFRTPNIPWTFSDYCWKPLYCQPQKFSIEKFCQKLNGRSILFVGDSIQHQFYDALWMQLETPGIPFHQWTGHRDILSPGKICHQGGFPHGRLVYLRNDQLTPGGVSVSDTQTRLVLNRDWMSVVHHFDILILNKGAHFIQNETDYVEQSIKTVNTLKHVLSNRDPKRPPIKIFFRTTTVGHSAIRWDAPAVTDLLDHDIDFQATLEAMHYFTNTPFKNFGWHEFPHRDDLTIQIFQESFPSSIFQVLDVREMSFLRPDNHRCDADHPNNPCDEMHFYMPGVADSWVYLLFNVL